MKSRQVSSRRRPPPAPRVPWRASCAGGAEGALLNPCQANQTTKIGVSSYQTIKGGLGRVAVVFGVTVWLRGVIWVSLLSEQNVGDVALESFVIRPGVGTCDGTEDDGLEEGETIHPPIPIFFPFEPSMTYS